jgi:multicomponent Na+:H+ antiporter subunit F
MVAILLAMGIVISRVLSVTVLHDHLLAVNTFGTITVVFIAVFGFMTGRPEFLDIALLYALINFIVTVCVLRFFEHGHTSGNDDELPGRKS